MMSPVLSSPESCLIKQAVQSRRRQNTRLSDPFASEPRVADRNNPMESEADKAAAPAPAAAASVAETSDDAIQEESPAPAPSGKPGSEAAAKPEVEVQLFWRGRGPVAVFRSPLGGYTQDQLEVGDILEQHGLKSVFVFHPASRTRGVAIRFHPRNGRSLLTYVAGSTIFLDGEPKVSLTDRLALSGSLNLGSRSDVIM